MRVPKEQDGITVNAISGTYVVLLGFDIADPKGLLGFAIHRKDLTENEERWIPNQRTFPGQGAGKTLWPSNEAPLQKFRWSDYAAKPEHNYLYDVYAVYGTPAQLTLKGPVSVPISTESPKAIKHPDGTVHEIHFNRGGAASQAYEVKFHDKTPEEVGAPALEWLSRGLLEEMQAYIDRAQSGDELHISIYEFQLQDVLSRIKAAADRGVKVRVVYDAGSGATAPRAENEKAIADAQLQQFVKPRANLASHISHHKFMVLVSGGQPRVVWTGSTNMTFNAFYAQLNVGHAIDNPDLAQAYLDLHGTLWANDPDLQDTRSFVEGQGPVSPPPGANTHFIFSPRTKEEAMEYYLQLMAGAQSMVVLTTPFGVDQRIADFLQAPSRIIKFGLAGNTTGANKIDLIDSINGVFYTMPARIDSVLDNWQMEKFQNQSHAYIHTKFLLIDPLGENPALVSGSANFSKASCVYNDEDMVVILGHKAAADVYFTEFMRMFDHYSFRHFREKPGHKATELPLKTTDAWSKWYFTPGHEREKDRLVFSGHYQNT